jgi:O-antigen/teichoic acid export membrane protein
MRSISRIGTYLKSLSQQAWTHRRDISNVSFFGYATLGLAFLLQVIIARMLGLEHYGIYATNLAVVALAEVPIVVRSGEIAMRAMAGGGEIPGRYAAIVRVMVRRDAKLFLAAYVVIVLLSWQLAGRFGLDAGLMSLLALSIPAQVGFGAYKGMFFALDRMQSLGAVELGYAAILIALSVVGFWLGDIEGLAVATAVGAAVKTWLAYWRIRDNLVGADRAAPASIANYTRDGLTSILRNGLSNGFSQLDIILLGQTQAPAMIALYKVGKSLTSLPIKAAFPMWRLLQPKIMSAAYAQDRARERRVVMAGSIGFVVVMLAMLPVAVLFGEDLIALAYGEQFRGAFEYFLILLVGVWCLNGIAGWFAFWCVVTRSQLYGIYVHAFTFVALLVTGGFWGAESPEHMAYVVSSVMVGAALLAYYGLLRQSAFRTGD